MRGAVFDLEANGLLEQATKVHCAVFKDMDTGEVSKFFGDNLKEMFSYMDSCSSLVAHNGISYDFPLLEKLYGYEYKGEKIDTLIISRLLSPKRHRPFNMPRNVKGGDHALVTWGYRVGRGKPEHEDWENFSPEMLHRCTEDVEITFLVYKALMDEAKDYNWEGAIKLTHRLFEILHKQEQYGWLVDKEYIQSKIGMLQHWMDRISKVLQPYLPVVVEVLENKVGGEYNYVKKPFLKSGQYAKVTERYLEESGLLSARNTDSRVVVGCFSRVNFRKVDLDKPSEVKDFLLAEGWIPREWNTNDAGERTSPKLSKDDPFEGIKGKLGRLVTKRVQAKHRKSVLEGWLKIIRPDGRIASSVANLALTGRAAHRGIVNVPNVSAFFGKQMRKCFIAPKGRVLVGCDAKSCQDRMLAARANNEDFTRMLLEGSKEEGTDGHTLATNAVNMAADKFNLPRIDRNKGKNFNFGWKFGASDHKLAAMLSADDKVGAEVRANLEKVFPAQAGLIRQLEEEWERTAKVRNKKVRTRKGEIVTVKEKYGGYIKGLDGRPIFVESPHALLVYLLQSDEAITMAAAYCYMYKRLIEKYQWGVDFAIVCWYHDEVTVECREEIAQDVARIMERCIYDAGKFFKLTVPQEGEAEIGKNWYEIH